MRRVVASLKYGRILRAGLLACWLMLALGFFFLGFAFSLLFGTEQNWQGFICACLCFVIFAGVALYLIVKNTINVVYCKRCLQDAVLVKAKTKGIKKDYFGFTDIGSRKLEVTFTYNKKKLVKRSGTKPDNGFDKVFLPFVDSEIVILYSPQFDEVMLVDKNYNTI